MKIKKILICLFILSLSSCNQQKVFLYLGENFFFQNVDFFSSLEEFYSHEINHDFSSNKFYMKDFYNQLEQDAMNLITSDKISDLLKKTEKIIFNIGNYEVLRLIDYNKYSFNYDQEVIKTSLEMFDYYFHQSLDILTDFTKDITIIPLYNSLMLNDEDKENYSGIIKDYNKIIYDNCNEFNVKYISIEKMSYFIYQDNHLSESGYQYLLKMIKKSYESNQ